MKLSEFLALQPKPRVQYWLAGQMICEVELEGEPRDETSRYFQCNVCLDIWAFVYYPNRFIYPYHVDCPNCDSGRYGEWNIPGSLLGPHESLDDLPDALIPHEFKAHLAFYQRLTQKGNPSEKEVESLLAELHPGTQRAQPTQDRQD